MKLILLYGIPIVIVVLLHLFGFTTDAGAATKAVPSSHAGKPDMDGNNHVRQGSTHDHES